MTNMTRKHGVRQSGAGNQSAGQKRWRLLAAASAATAGIAGVAAFAPPASAVPTLTNRYSFTNDATDSIGGANGNIVVNNAAQGTTGTNVAGGVLNLTANSGNSATNNTYLDLPNGIITDTTNFTVEGWATSTAITNWQRIFDFGTGSGGEVLPGGAVTGPGGTDYLYLSPQLGSTGTYGAEEKLSGTSDFVNAASGNFGTGAEHQFALTKTPGVLSLYKDGVLIARNTTATHQPAPNELVNDWIGRSQFNDPFFVGSIDEFRIYNGGALTASQVALDNALGPNTLAVTNTYTNPGSGDYNLGGNWSLGTSPSAATNQLAVLANGGNPTVTSAASGQLFQITGGLLTVSNGATLTLSGGLDFAPGSVASNTATVTVTGATLATAGLFVDGDTTTAGTSAKTLNLDGATLRATASFSVSNLATTISTNGATFDTGANNVALGGPISGGGGLTKIGTGILALSGANTFTGPVVVNAGLINAASLGNLGSGTSVTLNGGGIQHAAAFDLTARSLVLGTNGGTIDTNGFNPTYASPITGAGGLTKTGGGTLTLGATNTFTGNLTLGGGVLAFSAIGNLGSGTAVTFTGGTLQYLAGNTTDITTARTVTLAGAGSVDTGANNVTFAAPITGTGGSFTKLGTGTLTLSSTVTPTNLFVRAGTVVINGGTVATSAYTSIGQLNGDNGSVTIQNGGKLTVNGDFNVSDVAVSTGRLTLLDTSSATGLNTYIGKTNSVGAVSVQGSAILTINNLSLGCFGTSSGAIQQTGGQVKPGAASGDWRIGGTGSASDANAVGVYDLLGGTFTTPNNFQPGAFGKGQVTVNGGTATITNSFNSIGRFTGGVGYVNVRAGSYNYTGGNLFSVGEQGTGYLNVTGGAVTTTASSLVIGLSAGGVGFVNLAGGTVSANAVIMNNAGATSTATFNGGTLKATSSSATFMQGLTNAYVQAGGGTIDTGTNTITIAQNLLAPTGNGITTIPVANGGSGYTAAPIVQIVGGGGTGAAAVANLSGGVVTSITITNPGVGYTGTSTVSLLGGVPATAATLGANTFAANTSGGLTKVGTGTLNLTGASTYTGTTTVSAGILRLNGSISGPVTITGGTLGGTGTTNANPVTVASGGTLAPGNSVGTINTGNLAMVSGATYNPEVDGTAGTADLTNVTGTVNLGGATLNVSVLTAPTAGQSFTIISNDLSDPVVGTFAGLPQGAAVGGTPFFINYAGGDGNDVVLQTTPVPEPTTLGLLALGAAPLLGRRRRSPRRRA